MLSEASVKHQWESCSIDPVSGLRACHQPQRELCFMWIIVVGMLLSSDRDWISYYRIWRGHVARIVHHELATIRPISQLGWKAMAPKTITIFNRFWSSRSETHWEMLIRTAKEAKEKTKEKELPIADQQGYWTQQQEQWQHSCSKSSPSLSCSSLGLPAHCLPTLVGPAWILLP